MFFGGAIAELKNVSRTVWVLNEIKTGLDTNLKPATASLNSLDQTIGFIFTTDCPFEGTLGV